MKTLKNKLLILAFVSPALVIGQGGIKNNEDIIITKNKELVVKNARKISETPNIEDTTKVIPELNYRFIQHQYPVRYEVDPIQAANIKNDKLIKLYNGYVVAGIGTNLTPLLDVYYNSTRDKFKSLGFRAKHFSSNGINKIDYSSFSENSVELFGKKFIDDYAYGLNGGFDRNMIHFYGFTPSPLINITEPNDIRHIVSKFNLGTSFSSVGVDTNRINHNHSINYQYLFSNYAMDEHYLVASGDVGKYYGKEFYQLIGGFDYNNYSAEKDSLNNGIIRFRPQITTTNKKWRIRVGLNINADVATSAKFHFYPVADFKFNIVDNIIVPYGGIEGGINRNNFDSFFSDNPFVNPTLQLRNTNNNYRVYGGIKGSLSKRLTFDAHVERNKFSSMPLYVKNTAGINSKFDVIYDTVKVWEFGGELAYQQNEKLRFIAKGQYFMYDQLNELKAWHKPDYKFSLLTKYDLKDKIVVSFDVFVWGQQFAKTDSLINGRTEVIAQKINGFVDANLAVEYRYTKRISAFIRFNNIASVKYYRWQDYRTQQFNVLGGLTFSF